MSMPYKGNCDHLKEGYCIPCITKQKSSCLHDNCTICDGTGIRKDGLGPCIHMISCSCPKCSPRM